jgi:hypothetical protein
MRGKLALPAFQMDCRDWLIITPSETGLPDEIAGTPLLAVLSTVVLDADDFRSVSAVLTVGLFDEDDGDDEDDEDDRVADAPSWFADDHEDDELTEGSARYILPTPDGRLALLAEFTVTGNADAEINNRVAALMASFRWAA